jgi:hypothetical protein
MTSCYLFSMSDLERMLGAAELLSEMLGAVNPVDLEVSLYTDSLLHYCCVLDHICLHFASNCQYLSLILWC